MGELLTPAHLMVIAVVAFFVFGARKLPDLGKGLGEGLRGFRDGIRGLSGEAGDSTTAVPPASVTKLKGSVNLIESAASE